MSNTLTPAQKQYLDLKSQYKNEILFFRMGDFYEMFYEDAILASKILGITLTSRNKKAENSIPMAGIPYHSANRYIKKIIDAGYKIALCEQTTTPNNKEIVKREVVRVITPGTILEDDTEHNLDENYILSIVNIENKFGVAIVDFINAKLYGAFISDFNYLNNIIYKFKPKEIIFSKNNFWNLDLKNNIISNFKSLTTEIDIDTKEDIFLKKHFNLKSLAGLGIENKTEIIVALANLLFYLQKTQKIDISFLSNFKLIHDKKYMHLDLISIRNLEILQNTYDFTKNNSLLHILDECITPMGKRFLKESIIFPLQNTEQINERYDIITFFIQNIEINNKIKNHLKGISDFLKIISKIAYQKSNFTDFIKLYNSIISFLNIKEIINNKKLKLLDEFLSKISIEKLKEIYRHIHNAIEIDLDIILQRGYIKKGYIKEYDEIKNKMTNIKQYLKDIEFEESQKNNIPNLKIKYNKILGYFIEISKSHLDKIPDYFIERQTLVSSGRFTTQTLKKLESDYFQGEEKLKIIENDIINDLSNTILKYKKEIYKLNNFIEILDMLSNFANIAKQNKYIRPIINNKKRILNIKNGRHPILEKTDNIETFIPNDIDLHEIHTTILLTGPNMAGKSTYLRQNALLILMAQIGCFVPADYMEYSIFDGIYTRIGASDIISKGQSTFLVEMQEMANILNNSTKNSFIILDEIGRGTSTYDGLSLAWVILEYMVENINAFTIFATHYHELINLASKYTKIINKSIAIKENESEIVFLRKIIDGGINKSYGIEVAKLSGLPLSIINKAKKILKKLEINKDNKIDENQLSFLEPQVIENIKINSQNTKEIIENIKNIDLDNITPKEALDKLYKIKKEIK